MSMVRSRDGTPIAYTRTGDGPPVILMGGALNDQAAVAPVAELLAPRFTVLNYDRRGRGASGDTLPYSLEREIEDLEQIIGEAGGSAALFANCSGGVIGVDATARGLPITKLALYEPPYSVDGQRPELADDFVERITRFIREDRRGDAVRYFMSEIVQMPAYAVQKISNGPMWPWLERLAPSLRYDTALIAGETLPVDQLARIRVPTLAIDGGASPDWQRNAVQAVADLVAQGRRRTLEGQNHNLIAELVAPVLAEFFAD